MTKEPEQVLVEQRIAAFCRIEEMSIDQSIRREKAAGQHHCGHRENYHERGNELRPDKQRQAMKRHAGRAHLESRTNNDNSAHQP